MPRNMSFALTTKQMRARIKTVTRRMGWLDLKPGDVVQAVVKSQGLKKGEKVEKLELLKIQETEREPLNTICADLEYGVAEMEREGFPGMDPADFLVMFCDSHKGCKPDSYITRIQFSFLD